MIEAINHTTHLAKVTMEGVVNRQGVTAEIFRTLGQHGLNVELISTCQAKHNRADISFAIIKYDPATIEKTMMKMKDKYGTKNIVIDQDCALVNIYGPLLGHTPGIAGRIFSILADRQINLKMINASLSGLNLVVQKGQVMDAVAALRTEFGI